MSSPVRRRPPADARSITMSETDLLRNVIDTAHTFGWTVAHFRPAQTKHGWRTPVQGDGKGFPDLILLHPTTSRILAVELKSQTGTVDGDQHRWLAAFNACGITTDIWRPSHWLDNTIINILRG